VDVVRIGRHALLSALAACLVSPALAAEGGKDPTRRLQQQLRKAEQEKSQLTQQKAEAENQLKDVQQKLAEAQRKADGAAARGTRLSKELTELGEQKAALAASSRAEIEGLTAKLAEAERRLNAQRLALEAEKRQLEAALAKQKTALAGCAERNDKMHALGRELLVKYEQKGCFDSALQFEPFTGLKRVQVENLVEDFRDKFEAQRFEPAADGAAGRK
jgi:chromosome segregation ATPase